MRLATGRVHAHHVGLQHQEAEVTREQTQELGNTSLHFRHFGPKCQLLCYETYP